MAICDKFKKLVQNLSNHKSEGSQDNISQQQSAGPDSNQLQIGTVVVNQGISEERARNVFAEMVPQALDTYTKEAYSTANLRIEKLENAVMPRISQIDGALSAFSDPAFQMLLRKAQQTAAATERNDDYDLLSELLICHIQKGSDRKNRTGISKAVEIVDDIDNDALCGLTVVHAVNGYLPISGNVEEGLKILDNLFSQLLYMPLPNESDWIEHLDVLGAVRMTTFAHFKKIKEYYPEKLNGYACAGILLNSDSYQKAVEILNNVKVNIDILQPNPLMDNYVRLPLRNKDAISELLMISNGAHRKINPDEIKSLDDIWELYDKDTNKRNDAISNFMTMWDTYDSLKQLHEWWESIPVSFDITKVGTILAHTNAKRCNPSIPDLM